MTDDWYRVIGGEDAEGAVIVSQLDEPVDYSADALGPRRQPRAGRRHRRGHRGGQRVHPDRGHLPRVAEAASCATSCRCSARSGSSRSATPAASRSPMPQDAIEPVRRMCKWIVDEDLRPRRGPPTVAARRAFRRRPRWVGRAALDDRRRRRPAPVKTCVITGASAGLGRESARALAAAGAHVILAGAQRPTRSTTPRHWIARPGAATPLTSTW